MMLPGSQGSFLHPSQAEKKGIQRVKLILPVRRKAKMKKIPIT
jgi:hypothetical protein